MPVSLSSPLTSGGWNSRNEGALVRRDMTATFVLVDDEVVPRRAAAVCMCDGRLRGALADNGRRYALGNLGCNAGEHSRYLPDDYS